MRNTQTVSNESIPVGTVPQQTSRVAVLARTNCTRLGAGGFSTENEKYNNWSKVVSKEKKLERKRDKRIKNAK